MQPTRQNSSAASSDGGRLRELVRVALSVALLVALLVAERWSGPLAWLTKVPYQEYAETAINVAMVLLSLLIIRRHRAVPRTMLAMFALIGLFLLLARLDNRRHLGGDTLFLYFGYSALLSAGLCFAQTRWRFAHVFVTVGVLLGTAYLAATGILLNVALTPGDWLEVKNAHSLAGIYTASFVGAFLFRHVAQKAGSRHRYLRGLGIIGALALLGLMLTGINRVATGGSSFTYASTELHRWLAIIAGVIVLHHVAWAWWTLRGADSVRPPSRGGAARWTAVLLAGVALAVVHVVRPRPAAEVVGQDVGSAQERGGRLANPRTGITAATLDGAGISRALLSPSARQPGCATSDSCHQSQQRTWGRSAHRFAANPAYAHVVAELVREEGVASARLCASCHDPLPLLAGEMVAGRPYPVPGSSATSEGVACLVCHAARTAPGPEAGDGRYRLAPFPLLAPLLRVPSMQVMMVYEHLNLHFDAVRSEHLRSDALCAACHELQIGETVVRRTAREFREAAPRGSDGKPMSCRSCHMPLLTGEATAERKPHDHTVLGGNIGVAELDGSSTLAARVKFVADALELRAHVEGAAGGRARLHLELSNRGGGHGFPTAPKDLAAWWFEVRGGGGGGGERAWLPIGPASLFGERPYDAAGQPLLRHEIWKIHRSDDAGKRIAPGESRAYAFDLPEELARAVGTLLVRLRYRRFPVQLADALRAEGMMVESVEILRRAAPWGRTATP